MTRWGVHRLRDMIAPIGVAASPDGRRYYRAVPMPYPANFFERLRLALLVIKGGHHVIVWPETGDLEKALNAKN